MSNTKKAEVPLFQDVPAPLTFEEIREAARPRQTKARLCLAGDLAARAEELETQLEDAKSWPGPSSLADIDPRTALASELDELRELMRAKEITFRFHGLGRIAYSDLLAAHPPRKGSDDGAWNIDTFPNALIAACCIEPKMTVEQVDELSEVLNQRQRNDMWGAAWMAQVGETKVPTLRAVSTNP